MLTNIVGAIAESARTHENRELIREQEGLAPIIRLIASTSPGLLVNVAAAIGQMAEDVESLEQVGETRSLLDLKTTEQTHKQYLDVI